MTQPNQSCPRCNRRRPLCPHCITIIKKFLLELSVSEVARRFGFKIPTVYYYRRDEHNRKEPQTPAERSKYSTCNRAEFGSFKKYYTARPHAFVDLFGYGPENGNMRKAFEECKKIKSLIRTGEWSEWGEFANDWDEGYSIVGLKGGERNESGL